MPPFSAIEYRRYAAECVRLAQSTSNPLDKARLLEMVETFPLAEKHEATDSGHTHGVTSISCLFSAATALDYFRDSLRNDFSDTGFASHPSTRRHLMSPSIIPESRRCRTRARECRTMAERLRVQAAREQMLKAASDFERMAQDAEQREIAQGLRQLNDFAASQHRSHSIVRRLG